MLKWIIQSIFQRGPMPFVAVGYPRVGNTWLRISLGRYTQLAYGIGQPVLFDPGEADLFRKHGFTGGGYFTHRPLEWAEQTASDLNRSNVIDPFTKSKVLLLVRHPLDVVVSNYMYEAHRVLPRRFHGGLMDFIDDPVFGISKLVRFYQLWADELPRVTLWRYEDAILDAEKELSRVIVALFGQEPDPRLLAQAAYASSFSTLHKMESEGLSPVYASSGLRVFANSDPSNADAMHIRKGKVGGWREEIPSEHHDRLSAYVNQHMPEAYGYSSEGQ